MTWPTRRFAELVGVTVKALRHYEKRGLIAPERSRAGYRRYSLRDLARLERILALRSLGLPFGGIAALRKVAASRGHWPDGARRYIASLYDADVDTWERVMTFVERADS